MRVGTSRPIRIGVQVDVPDLWGAASRPSRDVQAQNVLREAMGDVGDPGGEGGVGGLFERIEDSKFRILGVFVAIYDQGTFPSF